MRPDSITKEFVSPIEKFRKPRWNKNIAKNSKILLWYEQGIGDELRFLSTLPFYRRFSKRNY